MMIRPDTFRPIRSGWCALVMLLLALSTTATAQVVSPDTSPDAIVMTLDEALQIALVNNHTLRSSQLDVDNATSLVKEGWGQLLPQVDLASNYTRSVRSVNPFAGSQAGGFFSTLGFIDWLAFNEQARTDGDNGTNPITIAEYFVRQQAGLDAAGIPPSDPGDNPFAIPNQFRNTLSISQKLFDGRAIWGASGAQKYLKPFSEEGANRQEQLLIGQVKQAFFGALLAAEQARVVAQSVQRTDATLQEVAHQVAQGIAPKFQRLTAEVELANLQTQLAQAQTQAALAVDDLKLLLGMPVEQPLRLRGLLDPGDPTEYVSISTDGAVELAVRQRPDLKQARINLELERVQRQAMKAEFLPTLNAFANISYIGNVPNNRLSVFSDPNDPFTFSSQQNGFFADSYWDWDVNVGFNLSWNLFNGFQSRQRMQQRQIAINKAEIQQEQTLRTIQLEVERALRNLADAQTRIAAQELNVERAELNYTYARSRLKEGVASPLDERQASDLLDQSRLNYLQAVFDYLVAKSTFETAVGMPPLVGADTYMTDNAGF